jgi:hypothetical protein
VLSPTKYSESSAVAARASRHTNSLTRGNRQAEAPSDEKPSLHPSLAEPDKDMYRTTRCQQLLIGLDVLVDGLRSQRILGIHCQSGPVGLMVWFHELLSIL